MDRVALVREEALSEALGKILDKWNGVVGYTQVSGVVHTSE